MVSLTSRVDTKPPVSSHTLVLRNTVMSLFEDVQASPSVKGEATGFLGSLGMGNSIC